MTSTTRDRLKVNESLNKGEALTSPNGRFILSGQKDGNMVLVDKKHDSKVLWSTNTKKPAKLTLQRTGNLVLLDLPYFNLLWQSKSMYGSKDSVFILRDDGDAVILDDGQIIWRTQTKQNDEAERTRTPADEQKPLQAGQKLFKNEALVSSNGRFRLVMQDDGNLVLYDKSEENSAIWNTRTHGHGGSELHLQKDGNLCVMEDDTAMWSSNTSGQGDDSSVLKVQDDGDVVLYSKDKPLWRSGTHHRDSSDERKPFPVGQTLQSGQDLSSPDGRFRLVLHGDCELTLHDTSENNRLLWTSKSGGARDPKATMKILENGNLVIYNRGEPRWQSWTRSAPKGDESTVLVIQNDGNMLLVSNGHFIWETNTRVLSRGRTNTLRMGEDLKVGESLISTNERFKLIMQDDGNLVVYALDDNYKVVWAAKPQIRETGQHFKSVLQEDGNFVIYEGARSVWASATQGNDNLVLTLQDTGVLVMTSSGKQIWTTEEAAPPPPPAIDLVDRLHAGESMGRGRRITSPNRKFFLAFQDDGNLVLYNVKDPVWATGANREAAAVEVRHDDSFVITKTDGITWSSGTRRRADGGTAELIIQDDGKLVLRSDGYIIWSPDSSVIQKYPPKYNPVASDTAGLRMGECLSVNQRLRSPDGTYTATLNDQGIITIRHKSFDYPLWRSSTALRYDARKLVVQFDGNCSILTNDDAVVWATRTRIQGPDTSLRLVDTGNLEISGWSSNIKYPLLQHQIPGLQEGEALLIGQSLMAGTEGELKLSVTETGNLCVTKKGQPTYYYTAAGLLEVGALYFGPRNDADLQEDDHEGYEKRWPTLCVRNKQGENLWTAEVHESGTGKYYREVREEEARQDRLNRRNTPWTPHPNYVPPLMELQNDGNMVINYEDRVTWSMFGLVSGRYDIVSDTLRAGEELKADRMLVSKNRRYGLMMREDAKLLIIKGEGKIIWESRHTYNPPDKLCQQHNGNLILYTVSGYNIWESGVSGGSEDCHTVLEDDGDLVTYSGGKAIWSSGSAGK